MRLSATGWPVAVVTSLHASLCEPFEPDSNGEHLALLETVWRSVLAPAPFERVSPAWKRVGFQGEDPKTDVRGGGVLAMRCLAHFATLHTFGLRAMLLDLADLEKLEGGGGAGFYPLSTTAIVLCARLCDALGISGGMRGPLPQAELGRLLCSAPPTTASADLRRLLTDGRRRGGFLGLFSLLLADFHVRFTLRRASYLESGSLADAAIAVLTRRAHAVGVGSGSSRGDSSLLAPLTLRRSPSAQGARAFRDLFVLYTAADEASDAGTAHAHDVHALLTATEMWRHSSLTKLRAAVRRVTLEAAVHDDGARRRQSTALSAAARVAEQAAATGEAAVDAPQPLAPPPLSATEVAVALSPMHVAVTLRVEAAAATAATSTPADAPATAATVRVNLLVGAPERPAGQRARQGTFFAVVDAALAAKQAHSSAQLQPPMHLALPTSSSMKNRRPTTNVPL